MASIVRNVTFFLLLFLSLVAALPAGASSERNSILSGVKAESASCFVRDGGRVSCAHTMENLDLHMDSGGTFSVDESWEETTGKVIPASGKGFSVPPGGRFELNKGKITNH